MCFFFLVNERDERGDKFRCSYPVLSGNMRCIICFDIMLDIAYWTCKQTCQPLNMAGGFRSFQFVAFLKHTGSKVLIYQTGKFLSNYTEWRDKIEHDLDVRYFALVQQRFCMQGGCTAIIFWINTSDREDFVIGNQNFVPPSLGSISYADVFNVSYFRF